MVRKHMRLKRLKRLKALGADSQPVSRCVLSASKGRSGIEPRLKTHFRRNFGRPADQVWEP
jgi:hypothetical protein